MSDPPDLPVPIWTRVVADPRFRDAVIDDPLRALADAPDVAASAEQIRQLEDMDLEQREAYVKEVVREVHMRGAQARFGSFGRDGRLGGPPD